MTHLTISLQSTSLQTDVRDFFAPPNSQMCIHDRNEAFMHDKPNIISHCMSSLSNLVLFQSHFCHLDANQNQLGPLGICVHATEHDWVLIA